MDDFELRGLQHRGCDVKELDNVMLDDPKVGFYGMSRLKSRNVQETKLVTASPISSVRGGD